MKRIIRTYPGACWLVCGSVLTAVATIATAFLTTMPA